MQTSSPPEAPSDAVTADGRWRFVAPRPVYPVTAGTIPTFSVVIPAYDASTFVGEAVRSALEQTARPLEIIVCDDGSSDDLAGALSFAEGITLVRQEHRGVAAARNTALRAATGEFVAILDADDVYLPERLEALGSLAAARPDLDILSSDAAFEVRGASRGRFHDETPFAVDDQRTAILERCFCPWPAIRRRRLLAVGGFDESLTTGSDWECLIRLILVGCAAGLVDAPLYRYRLREGSLTAARVDALRDRIRFLEKTAAHPGLRPAEIRALARSLAVQRRAVLLAEAESSLRKREPDARLRALRVARARRIRLDRRLQSLMAALAPETTARLLEWRERTTGSSNLDRPITRGR